MRAFALWRVGRRGRSVARLGVAVVAILVCASPVRAQDTLAAAVRAFWAAGSDEDGADERVAAGRAIVSTASSLGEAVEALRRGRAYSRTVETGRRLLTRKNRDGLEHGYVVFIPDSYDPATAYPVRVYLHGGVMRPLRDDGNWWRSPDTYIRSDSIVVFPASWSESIWWQQSQIENLAGVLADLKRVYNVDENRVYLLGVSDGATGAYYHAFKATTPWAGFLPFNGHPVVLANPASDVDGEMYPTNLRNKPLFVVNGGVDRLYPVSSVAPFIQLFQRAGIDLDFRPQPEAGHNMRWWPEVSPSIDTFIDMTRRDPLPDRLTWQTEDTETFNRAHWLVIDELGVVDGERDLDGFNMLTRSAPGPPLGLGMIGESPERPGLQLIDVSAGSLFERAGVEAGDLLRSVAGTPTPTVDALREQLVGFAPGDELAISVERNGELLERVLVYPTTDAVQTTPAFRHGQLSGRVDLVRDGNTVTAETQGVRRFTLLLSPDRFDFSRPIRVVTNGVVSRDAVVTPDLETLVRWAVVDQDRTLLFGAELEVEP